VLVFTSCTIFVPDDGELVIVSYNVQNLFDAVVQGTEYDDFTPEAGWHEDDVADRMQRLGAALSGIRPAPDVLVLTEIENEALFHRLLDDHLVDLPLDYRAFVIGEAAATGVGLAGRYPIAEVRSLLPRAELSPPLRPILEARIMLPEAELLVFANHWKSKRGGAEPTEELRRAAAQLIQARIREVVAGGPEPAILVVGDLNEQATEYHDVEGRYPTALMPAGDLAAWTTDAGGRPDWYSDAWKDGLSYLAVQPLDAARNGNDLIGGVFYDPWTALDGGGSYYYSDRWERIDHILMNERALAGPVFALEQFSVPEVPSSRGAGGRPLGWRQGGVSDHFPVMARFSRTGGTSQ
jgi:predicted extracellular nuclease